MNEPAFRVSVRQVLSFATSISALFCAHKDVFMISYHSINDM